MAKLNEDIIKFVEEGIFESGKAYAAIRSFEKYLKEAYEDFLTNYDWESSGLQPDFEKFVIYSSQRKWMGDWFSCALPIQIREDVTKRLSLVFYSSTMGVIKLHGYWIGEKNITYSDLKDRSIKTKKEADGLRLEMILDEKDRKKFNFNDYHTRILDILVKQCDQLQ